MENFIFISPDFPVIYDKFCECLKAYGFNVLAIGATPYHELTEKLKQNVTEYYYEPLLDNFENLVRAITYFEHKYGKIRYLESNNEYWLVSDAKLREFFNIEGLRPFDIDAIKHKSKMKAFYAKAGVVTVDYALVNSREDFDGFLAKHGYPLFIKPDVGVGAVDSYKIRNDEDKQYFFLHKKEYTYIVEPYVDGSIISYDALVDKHGDVVFETAHIFPVASNDIALGLEDDYFYSLPSVDLHLSELGRKVIKAFGIRKRAVHLEFFKLNVETAYGKVGDYVGLEVNMRSPGGYIPNLMSYASGVNYFDLYARMMNEVTMDLNENNNRRYGLHVTRRKELLNDYHYSNDEILKTYQENVNEFGIYPEILATGMGDYYFIATFNDLTTLFNFKNKVLMRKL